MDNKDGETLFGCLLSLWHLFITGPMWLVLLFAVLQACPVQPWAWVLYWCYVPCYFLGIILAAIVKQIAT